jgi:hypothetical protein
MDPGGVTKEHLQAVVTIGFIRQLLHWCGLWVGHLENTGIGWLIPLPRVLQYIVTMRPLILILIPWLIFQAQH